MEKQNDDTNQRIDLNNFVADPVKKNLLKKRLYDSGISNVPMASVKREMEQHISTKPYQAKMNTSKIQNLSNVKSNIDKVTKQIYSNLQESYKGAAALEAKYKGEGTAEYYKKQHVTVPPAQILQGQTKQHKLLPKLEINEEGKPVLQGMATTNRILLNKCTKPGQLPSLSDYGRIKIQETGEGVDPSVRLLQAPPIASMTGFEGGHCVNQKNLEMARSKYLLDKLTNKLPPELRKRQLPPLQQSSSQMLDQKVQSQKLQSKNLNFGANSQDEKLKNFVPNDGLVIGQGEEQKPKEVVQQQWSDLDKFIELLLDSKSEEETVFVYLNPNKTTGDPYDLEVVYYAMRDRHRYYTLSGKGLTLYENDSPVEFIQLGQWLIERDSYNQIKELKFFKQFKKWKFMRMWKKTIKKDNRDKARHALVEKLFFLQPTFDKHLMQHRKLMIDMENGRRFVDECENSGGETKRIDEFAQAQVNKTEQVAKEIKNMSQKSRMNIQECITNVLSKLRSEILNEITLDEQRRKTLPGNQTQGATMKKKEAKDADGNLGFPDGMTYGHRSSLRLACSKFLRFAFLVDFLALESLTNIYLNSLDSMIKRIRKLDHACDIDAICAANTIDANALNAPRGLEPLFYVEIKLDEKPITAEMEIKKQIDEFVLPPRGQSEAKDFDPLAHLIVDDPNEMEEEMGPEDEEKLPDPIFQRQVPNIEKHWLTTSPSRHEYAEIILKTFQSGLDQIKCFERWSKHEQLSPYRKQLEDWDDIVGDKWIPHDSLYLDPKTWIADNPLFKEKKQVVYEIIESAFGKIERFLTRFQPLLELYWRNKQFDMNILVDENLREPQSSLVNIIELFTYQIDLFNNSLPQLADIGLVQLDAKSTRNIIQPTPKQRIEQINKLIPDVIRERNKIAKQWIKENHAKLDKETLDVEQFVQQTEYYNYISENFQEYRDKVSLYGEFFDILDQKGLKVQKADKEAHGESFQEISKLQAVVQRVESNQDKEKEKFKKDMNQRIPKLENQINETHAISKDPKYLDGENLEKMFDIITELEGINETFQNLEATAEKYNHQQTVLDMQPFVFEYLDEARQDISLRVLMWRSLKEWNEMNEQWINQQFSSIDPLGIGKVADKYFAIAMRLEKNLDPNPIQETLKAAVEKFREAMPIVSALGNDKLQDKHRDEIKDLVKKDFDVNDENFTLKSLLDLDINSFQEEIVAISNQATQEYKLNKEIKALEEKWTEIEYVIKPDPKSDDHLKLFEVDVIYESLDESLSNINMILGSRFVKPLRAEAEKLKRYFQTVQDLTEELIKVQRAWFYLRTIFSAPDIAKVLQAETTMFNQVTKAFISFMGNLKKTPNCIRFVKKLPKAVQTLQQNNQVLEYCNNKLEEYMEGKRTEFPRFYFLSNDELIDILANSQDIDRIQSHLKALFDNLVAIEVDDQNVKAIISSEKEKVDLIKPAKARGPVELWLKQIQDYMIETLSKMMKKGFDDYANQDRKTFVTTHYGQIVATVAQIYWCQQVSDAIDEQASNVLALKDSSDQQGKQVDELIAMVRGQLTPIQRKIIVSLITTDVHAKDITDILMQQNVTNLFDFNWQKQLRYYFDESENDPRKNVKINQVSATLYYGYEYMGATSRLVITPLTDNCWITITNALHINLGANPAGPAGTGKTESTKDLAKAIAIQCIVYNCSDQVDYKMMGKLFSGLCQQGCWTCLDEFNRILIEVLSVIAQQLQQITKGLKAKLPQITFDDKEMPLKPEFGCHVTMNPGYAGRTELPDNLQVLFRPVAMMIPNYALIAEIMLAAEGFSECKPLSKKMVQLYKLSSEQLSQQDHYDFGLRAVKSVLVMAGGLKRANPDLQEDGVLIRAMRDANIPKFLKDDLPLFNAIVQDLFPSAKITENEYGKLKLTMEEITQNAGYQTKEDFIIKILQLHETFNVRFGVMLVGPTGSGKTVCYNMLQQTFNHLRENDDPDQSFQKVTKVVFNPKAIAMGELYGEVNLDTQEWYDGLASKFMRNAAMETSEDKTWIVFDGPVDALWIENMNTVLDDNMTLCLANGQRIKLRPQMRMLFEVQDLAVASPATVSRCGMVYFTVTDLGWRPYVKTWQQNFILKFEDEENPPINQVIMDHIDMLFESTIDLALEYIRKNCNDEPIKTTDLQLVVSVCNLLENFFDEKKGFKGSDDEKKKLTEAIFAWCYAWGLGASLTWTSKQRFDSVVREQFKGSNIPAGFSVFDYYFDLKKEKVFKPWTTIVPAFEYDKDKSYFELMVPTDDTTKHRYVLQTLLDMNKQCFFTGESGVGKSAVIQSLLDELKEKDLQPININMSAQTSSLRTQQTIEDKLESKRRGVLGAAPGKRVAIFVDDINMPAKEFYGAQPPLELLRLFLDRKGMYKRGEWEWRQVEDTTLIACAAPPGGGRSAISMRLTRIFNMVCLPQPTEGVLGNIFGAILSNFLATGFNDKVKALSDGAIQSTIDVYNKIQDELRPTPDRFHYLFNLRDVSKVVQGICMTKPVSITNDDIFMRLWVNEIFRVFYDRLINENDQAWLKELVLELISKNFKLSPDKDELFEKLKFGDLLKLDAPVQLYEYLVDKAKLLKALHGSLDEYNLTNSNKMNLVLFDDALDHLLKIARVLKQPRGHIMLIGVGGSGKQSLIRLCSFMRQMEFRYIEIFKGYKTSDFLDFMRIQMKEAGINQTKISFVLTDTQIIDEAFLENINNLLNTGEIPNLMAPEDKEEITNGVRPICNQRKILDTLDNIQALFVALVRENLHICLCMSPVGSVLRVRCRQFPSLVNCCTLDWFSRWPEQALLYVSTEFLKDLPDCSTEIKNGLAEMCMRIHISVEQKSDEFFKSLRRRIYTTPKSYLDLISLYTKLLEVKRDEFQKNRNRLAKGLNTLKTTNTNIAKLKEHLAVLQPQLVQKNAELEVSLEQVGKDKAAADIKEAEVAAEAEKVSKVAENAKVIADDAEADLAKAKPVLAAAKIAVESIDRDSIVMLSKINTPAASVKFIMQGCMALFGEPKAEWGDIQKKLGKVMDFLQKLQKFDPEAVKDKVWNKVRSTYLKDPLFDPIQAQSASMAAANIAKWAQALSEYAIVIKDVAPKKAKYAEVKAILDKAQADLKVQEDAVAEVKAQVEELERKVQAMQDEKQQLENDMERYSKQMARAEKLVVLLADEGVRWAETVEIIQDKIVKLVGDIFLSCACISYYGGFTGDYRAQLVKYWSDGCIEKEIPFSDPFSLVATMGDPVVTRSWGIAGLPSDQVSIENGILTTKAERYSLCIDPQQQANKWIKNMEKDSNLICLKFGTDTFLREVTGAVRNGTPVLVEDVEEIVDPAIDPILLKQQFAGDGGMMSIRLGDATVDFDEHFNLFMTTKMPNPHYIPEICIKVTLINFTVTFSGLEQQLLADVVIAEKPEVEKKRDEIVLTMAADQKTLKDLENNILKLLDETEPEQILDEDTLIDILAESKRKSTEIGARMEQSKIVEVEINETRNMYTSVSVRGSILYFVISDLAGMNDMYQNSLDYVKQLFNRAIAESPQADTIEQRLEILIDQITRILYTNVSRGLFEADKLIYSMLIASSIKKNMKQLDMGVWNTFLRGPTVMSEEEKAAQPEKPELVSNLLWETLYSAEIRCETGQFEGITAHINANWQAWYDWAQSPNPYDEKLPGDFEEKMSNFDKLHLIRTLRSELVQTSISLYVIREMGQFFVEPPSTQMSILYEDLSNCIPMIFVLSKGADPTSSLFKFAEDKNIPPENVLAISLGQGQGVKAAKYITQACEQGQWVLLQNCHLARDWMPTLEKFVLGFSEKKDEIHQDFRLFLTSMPADYFPVSVLQNSLKLTTEPPRGLKANLKRCYANYNQEYLDSCPSKPTVWRKMLFNFAFFHALIQERRKFGPLGWNIRYEFNDSDLETSNIMLKGFLENQEDIPWDALLQVTGIINYGGRVTDANDLTCLMRTLEKYCGNNTIPDTYKYSSLATYFAPADGKIEVYRDYIEQLPLTDPPEIFGLHSNANIAYMSLESNRIISKVLSIQPRVSSSGGGLTPDQIIQQKSLEFRQILPERLNQEEGLKELFQYNSQGLLPSLTTVLIQEMTKFNRLLFVLEKSLIDIDDAIQGKIVMDETLDKMYLSIQNNQVPSNWSEVSYLSLKPLSSWFKDMIERVNTIDNWLRNGNPNSFWLSGMFFPQGFMTGVLQTHARKHTVAIDKLQWAFEIQEAETFEEIEESPEDGVYIHGLYADGARWDRENLIMNEQEPTKLFDTMPVILFKPIEDYVPPAEEYQAPLYKAANREGKLNTTGQSTNFILHVSCPTQQPPSHWTQRAAALLCMLSD